MAEGCRDGGNAGEASAGASGATGESVADMTPGQRAEALAQLASEGDVPVRKSVAVALGRMGAAGTAALAGLLSDEDEGVRVLACQALGRTADPAAVPALLERVHDASAQVRAGVLFALANVAAHGGVDADARAALFTPMVVMAFDPDDGVRADAAATLGTLRDGRAVEPLCLLASDACPRVRANACASLGLSDAPEALPVLLARAGDGAEEPLVRVAALDGLARRAERGVLGQGTPEAEEAVELACMLAESLAQVEPPAQVGLSAPEERSGAGGAQGAAQAVAVRRSGEDGARGTEGDAAPSARDLATTAVWALGMLPLGSLRDRAQTSLEAALTCDDEWAQRYAIEALARIGDARAAGALRSFEDTVITGSRRLAPQVQDVLARGLGLLGVSRG